VEVSSFDAGFEDAGVSGVLSFADICYPGRNLGGVVLWLIWKDLFGDENVVEVKVPVFFISASSTAGSSPSDLPVDDTMFMQCMDTVRNAREHVQDEDP